MCNYHIPTSAEMSGKGLNKRNWKVNHFFGTAKYYTETAGFPNGKLPCHEEWCEFRQESCIVHVSVFRDNALNSHVTTLQKYFAQFADPPIIDEE